ncbi:MAG TPA: glycosyltransferase [Steroidobacteraceae bacterium]|nr:glycosyltransferase [Steroidobacteraceae bacterium]
MISGKSSRIHEFVRFAVVGAASALFGWILLYLLVSVAGLYYLIAFALSFLIMNAIAYLTVGSYAFRSTGVSDHAGLFRYYAISLASLGCNGVALAILVERLGLNYLVAAAALAVANAPVNFILHRRLTYRIGARLETQVSEKPLRVVVVTHYYPAHGGGIESIAGRIGTELAARHGIAIDWYASDCDAAPEACAVNVVPVAAWNGIERRTGLPYPLWRPTALCKLSRGIAHADVVQIHDFAYFGSLLAAILAKVHRVPLLLTQHSGAIRPGNKILAVLYSASEQTVGRCVFAAASVVACVSETTRAHFERRLGSRPKFVTIWNGLDVGALHAADLQTRRGLRVGYGLAQDTPIVLFAGRLIRKKGIEIVRGVATAAPNVRFLIAGRGPIDPNSWGLPNVRVLGQVAATRMVELYHLADLLLLPSYCEGFPLVVQEALACGTAVLSTDEVADACPPVADLIHHCPVPCDDDPQPWIAALRRALSDRTWLTSRDARAQRARQTWSWERCAQEYFNVIRQVARRPAAKPAA